MKNILKLVPLLILLFLVCHYNKEITKYIVDNYIYAVENIPLVTENEYKLNYNFMYVHEINDFHARNKDDLINALYTILNDGITDFTFYCEYDECENDINYLTNNENLSFINNFVHPYNSYIDVLISINSFGRINIKFTKAYSDDEIKKIEEKLNTILPTIINDEMNEKEKIIAFHDYIINNSKYDSNYIEKNMDDPYNPSHKASGILLYNQALCGGYADIMSIFLNKLNIPNYLIVSDFHVWNAVYLDGVWYHLDLTWDDPVTNNGSDLLLHKFLLITDEDLKNMNTSYHNYDKNVYLEFNA